MNAIEGKTAGKLAIAGLVVTLSACSPKEPPAPAPPPPPVVVVEPEPIPARPTPPGSAAVDMLVPAIGVNGVRMTVNANLSSLETVWNYRSALNVAALNCVDVRYQPILDNYKAILAKHGKRFTKINNDLDAQYRKDHGSRSAATRAREAYMTQVYNYFALPPAHDYFCDAALQLSQESMLAPPTDIDAHALTALPRLEAAFERFFQDFERFRVAAVAWDQKYLPILYPGIYTAHAPAPTTFGPGSGAVYTSATYGPSLTPDVTVAQPVAEDFRLTTPAPGPAAPAQAPATISQPVIQPVP